jgi:hypothetical protein
MRAMFYSQYCNAFAAIAMRLCQPRCIRELLQERLDWPDGIGHSNTKRKTIEQDSAFGGRFASRNFGKSESICELFTEQPSLNRHRADDGPSGLQTHLRALHASS